MTNYITTYTKTHFRMDEFQMEQIDIRDIAHALSMSTRANGHFPKFYSVAQHSICCATEAIERGYSVKVALGCLLHDGSEAYMCDITRPVKQHLLIYLEKEEQLQNMIYEKFIAEPLTDEERAQISEVDDAMLFNEFKYFMNEELDMEHTDLRIRPVYLTKSFDDVEDDFIAMFYKLIGLYQG